MSYPCPKCNGRGRIDLGVVPGVYVIAYADFSEDIVRADNADLARAKARPGLEVWTVHPKTATLRCVCEEWP